MSKILYVLIVFFLIFSPVLGFAQTNQPPQQPTSNPCSNVDAGAGTDASGGGSLPLCINQIYLWSLGIAALLAMLMMVFGGYMVMTAAGNAQQSSTGKEMIWASIVGLGILFAAYLILNTINPDLVDFSNLSTDPFQQTPLPAGSNINVNPNP
ncbi:MAG: hypothetical protein HYW51_00385 [Candidatus Doudnabacteria bacterium]|nr:hypothetical protein [Candidatus Doudnabacteria bacterium]